MMDSRWVHLPTRHLQSHTIGSTCKRQRKPDANGNLTTQYTYDPFGGTTASGAASANPNQYIGQENDLTGLYYFHARYYSPALHRFISEDPLGFGGGDVNLHAYVGGSPTNFGDPTGLSRNCYLARICGAGSGTDADSHKSARGDTF
ncbi:MAG TPA: RHS repeat-associated core domain-containing protein, partial [Candidatus Angelobacter sp.]